MTLRALTTISILFIMACCRAALAQADPAPQSSAGISLRVEQFGVGGIARAGEWAGIRVQLDYAGPRPRDVAVRLHRPDDDGDTRIDETRTTLNPGITTAVWLYDCMPWDLAVATFVITVHEFDPASGVGRQLFATRVAPGAGNAADANRPIIGVIGRRELSLGQYEMRRGGLDLPAHQHAIVVSGITPIVIPDQWHGLAQFDTLVWTEGDPGALGSRDAPGVRAITNWVRRGGHLVVVLPAVGSTWFSTANPLYADEDSGILPHVAVTRHEDAPLEPYRGLITRGEFDDEDIPIRTIVQAMAPLPDARPLDAIPILSGPEGCIAMRRIVGNGMVTVIGLNLNDTWLANSALLRADAFWHRILGRRFDVPAAANFTQLGTDDHEYADRFIATEIDWTTSAGVGVLLALVVFGAYWLVAGPGGFALLKAYRLERHAWVGFVAAAAAFTVIAWAGATAMKQRSISADHLTFLDQVAGSGFQRGRTWASVLLPNYGETTLSVGDPDDATPWSNAINTWSAPDAGSAQSFPDARPYPRDVNHLDRITSPARATVKQISADWYGTMNADWQLPRGIAPGWEPILTHEYGDDWSITGKLTHGLPATLRDVRFLLVTGQIDEELERAERSDRDQLDVLLANAYMFSLPASDPWDPGEEIDLADIFRDPARAPAQDTFQSIAARSGGFGAFNPTARSRALDGDEIRAYQRISFLSMLPSPRSDPARPQGIAATLTQSAHGLDLSRWLTQPCLIIIGHVDGAPAPTPLFHGGASPDEIPSAGRTIVRCIFPLAPKPPVFDGVERRAERARDRNNAARPTNR